MKRRLATYPALLLLVGALACGDIIAPWTDVTVRTDGTRFAPYEEILAVVRNDGRRPAAFWHCGGGIAFTVEQRLAQGWTEVGSHNVICPAIHQMGELLLAPGQEIRLSLSWAAPGEFRLRFRSGSVAGRDWFSNGFSVD